MWIIAATLSAVFAGVTAVLSKIGIRDVNSDVATALRTLVVVVLAWVIVFATGVYSQITSISVKSWIFLTLSGLATGASWLCYYKALSDGEVTKVAAVDKSSVILSVVAAILIFPDERNLWYIKLVCLFLIAVGTYCMTDIKNENNDEKKSWLVFAMLSAVFAAATSLLAKIGIENVNSNLATAIRTTVVLVVSWLIVLGRGEIKLVREVKLRETLFLILSGIATGVSWLCYYYAIQKGEVSVVVPVDKLSILITVLFSVTVLKEKMSFKAWLGLALLVIGVVVMAVFT